ncbi:hypothetical protein A3Q56_03634 [Intoshia linei]|uniref:Mononegavirales mRNA-capping domain-containing protein n=1 Tax=Intoshia linei TaxID=1819745 RepID=A0A177B2X5_9BILA|nr:hypothetical protein A3Q56_03634 [Intoshia linei]
MTHRSVDTFLNYLYKIKPFFPRFLSSFFGSTLYGYTDAIDSTIQNASTIRLSFTRILSVIVYLRLLKTEATIIKNLESNKGEIFNIWDCSSSFADQLRTQSWGKPLLGVTVPHPY